MLWAVVLGVAGLSLPAGAGDKPDRIPVLLNGARVEVEVAANPAERRRGLSGRDRLAADAGMLFVWPGEDRRTFWMKDTTIPLAIAFMDRHGRILNIAAMEPRRRDRFYRSRGNARFALEVNQGWFRAHGVEPGDRVHFRVPARHLPGPDPFQVGTLPGH
jgi:hypothetical protein